MAMMTIRRADGLRSILAFFVLGMCLRSFQVTSVTMLTFLRTGQRHSPVHYFQSRLPHHSLPQTHCPHNPSSPCYRCQTCSPSHTVSEASLPILDTPLRSRSRLDPRRQCRLCDPAKRPVTHSHLHRHPRVLAFRWW